MGFGRSVLLVSVAMCEPRGALLDCARCHWAVWMVVIVAWMQLGPFLSLVVLSVVLLFAFVSRRLCVPV